MKALLDKIDEQKSSIESKLHVLSELRDKERQEFESQLDDRDTKIQSLDSKLNDTEISEASLANQLSIANNEISSLTQYKQCAQQILPSLQTLKSDVTKCRSESQELVQLVTSSVEGIVDLTQRMANTHSDEKTKLEESARELQDQFDYLQSVVKDHEAALVEARTTKVCLERKVKYLEENAQNVANARTGERLSWEQELADRKSQHQKEMARVTCMSMDEQDILGNQIADLKDTIKKQEEKFIAKERLIELDWSQRIEEKDALIARVKFESALEIQTLSLKNDQLNNALAAKDSECTSLLDDIDTMKEKQVLVAQNHQRELDTLSHAYQNELEKVALANEEQIQQKVKEIEQVRQEKEDALSISQQQIDDLNSRSFAERTVRISELKEFRTKLDDLHQEIEVIQEEYKSVCISVNSKLKGMERRYESMVEKHNEEMIRLQNSNSEAEEALNVQIAAITKEANDAKSMLFNTIRENKTKLERALRNSKEDHQIEITVLTNSGRIQCEVLSSKLKDLQQEYETLACANAKKVDVIIQKDRDINILKTKVSCSSRMDKNGGTRSTMIPSHVPLSAQLYSHQMSDVVKSHEEEIHSIQVKNETKRAAIMKEMEQELRAKEDKFAQERLELQSEAQSKVDAVAAELREAKNNRSSLPKDAEEIQSL